MNRYEISVILLVSIIAVAVSLPQQPKSKRPIPVFKNKVQGLELPSNATSIRENIVDTFSCEGRIYGYYADVENECQVFHVCLPQERGSASRWSFICPAETVFNQATFVCTRTEGSIPCEESEQYYALNEEIGKIEEEEEKPENPSSDSEPELATPLTRASRRGKSRKITETTEAEEEPAATTPTLRNARISSKYRFKQTN